MAKKKGDKEIIRTVSLNGETFAPGQEDELEEAFKAHAENDEEYDHDKNIERLTKQGAIVGFGADVDEDDMDEADIDRAANKASGNAHLLQSKQPLERGAPPPPTMSEVQLEPDSNVVDMYEAGGPEKHAASGEDDGEAQQKREAARQEALEQRTEAAVQQESEQVPAPEGQEKRTARKKTTKKRK